ncbi:hypothetical protein OSB04_020566 [Centaurea solstitialis]|uniref:Uncharacterized protein n=1 Tax=Centaurea solstitialis TaxID=347529 RepID=A0AA38SSX4_9ASTR|nr:hypothetical protein OSB04_020566 [Centaurea solstitialis]
MEPKNQTSSSSSSFTNQLFGSSKESCAPSSSSGLFNSIFPRPSKPHGNEFISSESTGKNHGVATKQEYSVDKSRNPKKDTGPFYDQERSQPCHLSSSIYYGGQDIYTNPQIPNKVPGKSTYEKEGEDDGHASRGNWWQGN